jgi:2-oxoglutarate dehydrogenase E2 component (dihydrolipoamide succinyltransferase)
MKVDVLMPILGEGITEGTIVKWWKKPGDYVKKEETLLEISTDKVDSEIPSPHEGKVVELKANENDTVEVENVIAIIETDSAPAEADSKPDKPEPEVSQEESKPPQPETEKKADQKPPAKTLAKPSEPGDEIPARQAGERFYSPLVRSIARKEGIAKEELAQIPGTGLEGRVTKDDILQYLETRTAPPSAPQAAPVERRPETPPAPAVQQPMPSAGEVSEKWQGERAEVVPMDAIRKKIADHMVLSKHTSPHVYGVAECDFTNVMAIVSQNKAAFQQREGFKLTINPFILVALTKAVKDFPDVNCSIEGYNVIKKKFVNIGMAVATERGLIVPVLKNAGELNFTGVARNAYDLAIRTRDRKLNIEDVQGATITVTNYGVFGNIIGFPIINQPNVVIMGVGAVKKRPVVIETVQGDMIGIRSIGFLTLSYDHRTVDGELGDKFLQRVRHYIENFQEAWM